MLAFIKSWFNRRRPLKELLSVEFDDQTVRVTVLAHLKEEWNQSCEWSNIKRVCFKDGGMFGSDIIYISLKVPDKVCTIPTMALGGSDFFGALCDKGFLPEAVWRRMMGESGGGMHCWPEK